MHQKINMDLIGMTSLDERISTTEAVIKELKRKLAEERTNLSAYKQEARARGWIRTKPLGLKVTAGTAIYNNWFIREPTKEHVCILESMGLSVSPFTNTKYLVSADSSKHVLYSSQKPDSYLEIVLHNHRLYFREP